MEYRNNIQKKTEITITLHNKELLYDISNLAYIESDVVRTENNKERKQVADVTQDGNIDLVMRIIDKSYNELIEILYPHTKQEIEDGMNIDNAVTMNNTSYSIKLNMPETFSKTGVVRLKDLIHEYIVSAVMAEWMLLTNVANPGSAEKWLAKKEDSREGIKRTLTWRTKPLRIKQQPF